VVWGAWHFLQALWVGGTSAGAIPLILYVPLSFLAGVAQLTAYRVLMVWVYDRTESLLVATLMHASLSTSTIFVFTPAATGAAFLTYAWTLAAVLWIVVAAVVFANRVQPARQPLSRRAA
jgi:predicted membrane channel-forming protein YqfA (hemolysin III family)